MRQFTHGQHATSRLHFEGKTYAGEALLETSELIFRGERRLLIPFAKIESVEARDVTLRFSETHTAEKFVIPLKSRST